MNFSMFIMEGDSIKEQLRQKAKDLGFPLFGVAPIDLNESHRSHFNDWLAMGYAADMSFLAKRRDIRDGYGAVFPGARTVIVLGLPYKHSIVRDGDPWRMGWVSQYASGRDYHRLFEKRLGKLARFADSLGGNHRAYVDYGPILERAYGAAAGLGFIGKNCCLINPELGSMFFLGVVVSTLELPLDSPVANECRSCDRCLKACPSGALVGERTLDAGLCISYHSIENRGRIPEEIRPKMGRWILGCDMCQIVCPYNRKAPDTKEKDFTEIRIRNRIDLETLFDLDEKRFREKYNGTAAMHPGRINMLRNAIIAAGNSRDPYFAPLLKKLLDREDETVLHEYIHWAVSRLSDD